MRKVLLLILLMQCSSLIAQPPGNGIITASFNYQRSPYGFISTLPLAPSQTLGEYFLTETWLQGDIYMVDSFKIENVAFKYNIKDHALEILVDGHVKTLNGDRVNSFQWINNKSPNDGTYVNAGKLKDYNLPLHGFVKILFNEKFLLICHYETAIIKAHYNASLDVGKKDHQIVKNESFYLAYQKKSLKVKQNLKRFMNDVHSVYGQNLREFVKERKIRTKNPADLILIAKKLSFS